MKYKKLFLDYGLEVEEYRPAACIPNQIRSQASIEALDWMLFGDELLEDAESADGGFRGVAVDW
jgi:hypothetical protein